MNAILRTLPNGNPVYRVGTRVMTLAVDPAHNWPGTVFRAPRKDDPCGYVPVRWDPYPDGYRPQGILCPVEHIAVLT